MKSATPKPISTAAPQQTEQTYRAVIAAVGDVLIHKSIYFDAKTEDGYNFIPMFKAVKPFFQGVDLAIANQETMIGGEKLGLSDYPRFNSPFAIADALKDLGINAVSIANNHTLDRGEQAIINATAYWTKLGIPYAGAYRSAEDQQTLRIIEKNHIRFALLSYTYGTNGIPVPSGKDFLVNLLQPDNMKNAVLEAKKRADLVIVYLHFGQEYQTEPSQQQIDTVHQLADAGADIIFSSHPHFLQPAEWITQADGRKTFVIYSLGNFISAQDATGQNGILKEVGGILKITAIKKVNAQGSEVSLESPSFIPTFTYKNHWRHFKVLPLSQVADSDLPIDEITQRPVPTSKHLFEQVAKHMRERMPDLQISP